MTQRGMMRKLKMTFGLLRENTYRHHVEPRVKLYIPNEEWFPSPAEVHWRDQNQQILHWTFYWRNIDDYWNVDGERIITCMDRLHKVHFIERKATWRIYMVWRRLTRKQTTSRPDSVWPDMWKRMSDMQRKAKRSKSGQSRNQLRDIFFIEPDDE